jgi:hypothetical protein
MAWFRGQLTLIRRCNTRFDRRRQPLDECDVRQKVLEMGPDTPAGW